MIAMSFVALAEQSWANDTTTYAGDQHADTTWAGVADGSIAVAGLSQGDTVKFFKVLAYDPDAHYTVANAAAMTSGGKDSGAMSWKLVSPFTTGTGEGEITLDNFKDILNTGISSTLAGKIASLVGSTPTYTKIANEKVADGNYKAQLPDNETTAVDPGLYVAIVEPKNADYIYNPIFVANDYYKTGDASVSNIWTAVESPLSYSNSALAKKEPVEVKKTAAEPEASEPTNEQGYVTTAGENNAKSVGKGDTVNFTVTTTIPAYASNYTNPIFIVTDKMTSGLSIVANSVTVYEATVSNGVYTKAASPLTESATTFALSYGTAATDPDYKVAFVASYIKAKTAPQPIVIEYSATVTEDAIENVHEEDNTVTVEYSHKPDVTTEGDGKKVKDRTHHYTYTIDGNIWGDSEFKSYEVVKVGIDKNGNEIQQTTLLDNGKYIGALQGAEFKLYTTDPDIEGATPVEYSKGAYATATATTSGNKIVSDAGGRLTLNGTTVGIPGLDAGTYWLKEMKAPDGYIKQQKATKIEIIPTYYREVTWTETEGTGENAYTYTLKSDDLLKSYIVKVDNVQIAEYTLNYTMNGEVPANDVVNQNTDDMKTTNGAIIISNNGPVTTTTSGTVNTEGKILNTQGTELPSTGGMGTTILYVAGSILVLAAAILLITKRRMNADE